MQQKMAVPDLLQVSAHMEEVFYRCFESRLKLDPELDRMRAEEANYEWRK